MVAHFPHQCKTSFISSGENLDYDQALSSLYFFTFQVEPASRDMNKDVSAALSVGTASGFKPEESGPPMVATSSQERSRWEQGAPDYKGADSFDNIIKKLDSTMSTPDNSKFILLRILIVSINSFFCALLIMISKKSEDIWVRKSMTYAIFP